MEEKKHVGRPTNEEVANRKKKKVIKYSLITIASILIVGGITLFFNRDNIDFISLMGNSSSKLKYVVNHAGEPTNDDGGFFISFKDSKISSSDNLKSCKVTIGSSKAKCKIYKDLNNYGVLIQAKKKGTVYVKVTGYNNKNKKVNITKRVTISKDFKAPICTVSTSAKSVKKGNSFDVLVNCNEKINLTDYVSSNPLEYSGAMLPYYDSVKSGSCNSLGYYPEYISDATRVNDKQFKLTITIPRNGCSSDGFGIYIAPLTFQDSTGNMNDNGFRLSNLIKIN